MHGQSKGSVTLKSADFKDTPVLDLQYNSHPYDQRAMVEIIRNASDFVEKSSIPTGDLVLGPNSFSDKDISVSFECRGENISVSDKRI